MNKRDEAVLEEFREKFNDAFSRNNPVVQVKGHHEKEYLHKTYPSVTRFHPDGDVTIHPARYEASRIVSEGSVDEREVYVTEKQWKMSDLIEEFLLQKLQEERERVMATIKKEKETWANQSIGWKAVESVENALNHQK